ncbi:2-dehydropantoate 2-reductase N-terminal domain-containing protein [Umezawaea sp. Da 62-37]|uniref:2-dehydropantoate 2-reductase N-terminal domain-containing protein n=1 Tax=Umezawaea sp. Da 62-37 TaxID=3075927 RepID=UPI0028F6CCFD|nr:2-dehydropantoate 2-reductase N-terminal domain-containing protein [Umezawaea sp. Da 62-37]WNV87594.1 2-dehydropantoate 2-reductase N-terminal domain-containing protein [Umezawaea sp. Da 62-37]
MSSPSALVVGAGAVGMSLGYHLGLAGADITFLVRAGRTDAFAAPRQLYDYNDNTLKTFDGYEVVEDTAPLDGRTFAFVVITLDGHTSRTAQGAATLRAIGDLVHDTDAVVLMDGIGVDLRRHYLDALRIPGDRLLLGFLGMLAHQADANLPVPPGADAAAIAAADVCYVHPPTKVGFTVVRSDQAAAKSFALLYDRSGVSRVSFLPAKPADVLSNAVFAVYAACDVAGWPPIADVIADKPLWTLACRAQAEIMALPRNGLLGKVAALFMRPRVTAAIHRKQEKDMRPLDTAAFNRFHHGGKVRRQGMDVLRDSVTEGQRQGRPMTALRTLLTRAESLPAADQTPPE